MEKSPKKSPRKPRVLQGVAVNPSIRGRGPKKGAPNAGRPPDEFKARLRAMASRDEVLAHVESVLLEGPEHPYFAKALEYVTEHGYGKAANSLDITTAGQALVVRFVNEAARRTAS